MPVNSQLPTSSSFFSTGVKVHCWGRVAVLRPLSLYHRAISAFTRAGARVIAWVSIVLLIGTKKRGSFIRVRITSATDAW